MVHEMLHELFKAKMDFFLYYYSTVFSFSSLYVKVLVEKSQQSPGH